MSEPAIEGTGNVLGHAKPLRRGKMKFRLLSYRRPCHSARSPLRLGRCTLKNYLRLNLSLLYWVFVAPFAGKFWDVSAIFRQMVFIGVRAAPMVALTAFSIGVTLAMQAAHSLQQLGAEIYVPDLVMVTLLREMAPVLFSGHGIVPRGSAAAAQLGTRH